LNYSSEQIVKRPLGHCCKKTSSSWGQKGDCLVFKDREGLSHTALLLHTFPLETQKAVCLILGSSATKTSQPFGQKIFADLPGGLPLPALILDHRGYLKAANVLFQNWVQVKHVLQRSFTHWLGEKKSKKTLQNSSSNCDKLMPKAVSRIIPQLTKDHCRLQHLFMGAQKGKWLFMYDTFLIQTPLTRAASLY